MAHYVSAGPGALLNPALAKIYFSTDLFIKDVDLVFTTDDTVNIGNATDNRPANVYASASFDLRKALGLAATASATKGLFLVNETNATAGATVQMSPSLVLGGEAWDTDGGGTNTVLAFRQVMHPTSAAVPVGQLIWACDPGDGTYDNVAKLTYDGTTSNLSLIGAAANLLFDTDASGDIGAASANRPDDIHAASSFNAVSAMALAGTASATKGLFLVNTTNSTAGATVQVSPSIVLGGEAWDTDGGGTNTVMAFREVFSPTSAAVPVGQLIWACDPGDGTYDNVAKLTYDGTTSSLSLIGAAASLLFDTDASGDIGAAAANRPDDIHAASSFNAVSAMALAGTASATKGLFLVNTTDATAGATVQMSPSIVLGGESWDTDGGGTNTVLAMRMVMLPTSGATPSAQLILSSDPGDGTFDTVATFSYNGTTPQLTMPASGNVKSPGITASGDIGGEASTLTLSNATAAKDSTAATLGNTPTGIAGAHAAWVKVYVGTTTAYVPYWTA